MYIMCSAFALKHLNIETQLKREMAKRVGEADYSADCLVNNQLLHEQLIAAS